VLPGNHPQPRPVPWVPADGSIHAHGFVSDSAQLVDPLAKPVRRPLSRVPLVPGITRGAAVGHAAWAGRTRTHPRVVAALAAGQVPESAGRLICLWTNRLPERSRDESDEVLLAAAAGGLGVEELAALAAQMYERARGDLPDEDPDAGFTDRALKLATTFGGAGVLHGDLTPECAEVAGRVLDALAAPAGKEDDRTKDQRYHDALAEAMRSFRICIVILITSTNVCNA
jgi:hypothetical protein